MKSIRLALLSFGVGGLVAAAFGQPKAGQSPVDHLPPHIVQLTAFGERPDWSPDGKKILFLTKTFGDALEMDVATRSIRNRTAHYPHHGYTRAMYLPNGDILLAGPEVFDPKNTARARWDTYLSVLDKGGKKRPVPLGVRMNEGPAVSRRAFHIAWAEWSDPTEPGGNAGSKMYEADIEYADGTPKLSNRRLILDAAELPFRCTVEPQNFRAPDEKELTFSAYSEAGRKSDVCTVDLQTKKVTNHTHSQEVYDEPEGIFPDGHATLVECDEPERRGNVALDIWSLSLDGKGTYRRLTHFCDFPTYKASNPVVSDDGRFIAFQMGRSGEEAGVGHGLFLFDLGKFNAQ